MANTVTIRLNGLTYQRGVPHTGQTSGEQPIPSAMLFFNPNTDSGEGVFDGALQAFVLHVLGPDMTALDSLEDGEDYVLTLTKVV